MLWVMVTGGGMGEGMEGYDGLIAMDMGGGYIMAT